MRYFSSFLAGSALVLGFCLALTGCARGPSEAPAAAPIPVTVSYPVERYVTDYADFTARTAAVVCSSFMVSPVGAQRRRGDYTTGGS